MSEIGLPRVMGQVHYKLVGIAFMLLMLIEALLLGDVLSESLDIDVHFYSSHHILLEWLSVLGLGIILIFVGTTFWQTFRENRKFRIVSEQATGEFLRVMVRQLQEWALSSSELEIALMLIKGLSIHEIASIRMTKEGTIKSQCSAIYRKAGVSSRNELAAFFIEDLMSGLDLSADGGARIARL